MRALIGGILLTALLAHGAAAGHVASFSFAGRVTVLPTLTVSAEDAVRVPVAAQPTDPVFALQGVRSGLVDVSVTVRDDRGLVIAEFPAGAAADGALLLDDGGAGRFFPVSGSPELPDGARILTLSIACN